MLASDGFEYQIGLSSSATDLHPRPCGISRKPSIILTCKSNNRTTQQQVYYCAAASNASQCVRLLLTCCSIGSIAGKASAMAENNGRATKLKNCSGKAAHVNM